MEVYKIDGLPTEAYYFVYKRVPGQDAVMTLKVSGGSLGKWGFHKFPEERFARFHHIKYKGPISNDIQKKVFEAIFKVPSKTVRDGPAIWA